MAARTQSMLSFADQAGRLPAFGRLRLVFGHWPDEAVVASLEPRRGHGRDDYPVGAMWRALLARFVLQHQSDASFLGELERSPTLLDVCGFDALGRQSAPKARIVRTADGLTGVEAAAPWRNGAPTAFAFSRFARSVMRLERHDGLLAALFVKQRRALTEVPPDCGRRLGADGKRLRSHSTGRAIIRAEGRASAPDAAWGVHARGGGRASVFKCFGFTLSLVADAAHELPVAFPVEKAGFAGQKALPRDLRALLESEPGTAERRQEFTAGRGCGQGALKQWLWDDFAIRPIIDSRRLWRGQRAGLKDPKDGVMLRPLRQDDWTDNAFLSEKGVVSCRCPETGLIRRMALQGHERARGANKHRCPAAAYGLNCEGGRRCSRTAGVAAEGCGRTRA